MHGMFTQSDDDGNFEVKYYKGKNGINKIYEAAFAAKELRSYVNLSLMSSLMPGNGDMFAEALKKNNEIQIYEIIDGSPESRAKTNSFGQSVKTLERYTYKFLPDNVSLTAADILIYDGYVSIINIGERPTGVVLKNNDYYKNSKELFDFIWQLLPENK